jgi:hypothetical protein
MPRKGTESHAEVLRIMNAPKKPSRKLRRAPSESVTYLGKESQKRIEGFTRTHPTISSKMEVEKKTRKLRKEAPKPDPFDKEKFLVKEDEQGNKEYTPLSEEEERSIVLPEGSLWVLLKSNTAKKYIYNIYEEQGHTLKLIMTENVSNIGVDEEDETFKLIKDGEEVSYRVSRNTYKGNIQPKISLNGPFKPMVGLMKVDGDMLRRVNLVRTAGKNRKFGKYSDEPYNP